jgi:hypothetical protein
MILFFFKRQSLTLDCFTYDSMIARTAPILPAIKFYPQWIRDLPGQRIHEKQIPGGQIHHVPEGTMKGCPGVIDYFKTGFIAPLWVDASIIITVDGQYSYTSADSPFSLETHWPGQWDGFNGYIHMKMIFPWHIEEKSGAKFLLQKPMWTTNSDPIIINKIVSAGGVIDFNSQHCLHLHTFVEIPQTKQEFIWNVGMPLLHMIPLTDKKIKIRTHVIDETEWIKKTQVSTGAKTFLKPSLKKELFEKSINEGCPFK